MADPVWAPRAEKEGLVKQLMWRPCLTKGKAVYTGVRVRISWTLHRVVSSWVKNVKLSTYKNNVTASPQKIKILIKFCKQKSYASLLIDWCLAIHRHHEVSSCNAFPSLRTSNWTERLSRHNTLSRKIKNKLPPMCKNADNILKTKPIQSLIAGLQSKYYSNKRAKIYIE